MNERSICYYEFKHFQNHPIFFFNCDKRRKHIMSLMVKKTTSPNQENILNVYSCTGCSATSDHILTDLSPDPVQNIFPD